MTVIAAFQLEAVELLLIEKDSKKDDTPVSAQEEKRCATVTAGRPVRTREHDVTQWERIQIQDFNASTALEVDLLFFSLEEMRRRCEYRDTLCL